VAPRQARRAAAVWRRWCSRRRKLDRQVARSHALLDNLLSPGSLPADSLPASHTRPSAAADASAAAVMALHSPSLAASPHGEGGAAAGVIGKDPGTLRSMAELHALLDCAVQMHSEWRAQVHRTAPDAAARCSQELCTGSMHERPRGPAQQGQHEGSMHAWPQGPAQETPREGSMQADSTESPPSAAARGGWQASCQSSACASLQLPPQGSPREGQCTAPDAGALPACMRGEGAHMHCPLPSAPRSCACHWTCSACLKAVCGGCAVCVGCSARLGDDACMCVHTAGHFGDLAWQRRIPGVDAALHAAVHSALALLRRAHAHDADMHSAMLAELHTPGRVFSLGQLLVLVTGAQQAGALHVDPLQLCRCAMQQQLHAELVAPFCTPELCLGGLAGVAECSPRQCARG
jgi:hypothetical protein